MPYSDKEIFNLIHDAKTRKKAFSIIVTQYSEQLYWKIRQIVLIHEDADDVMQNSFIKIWERLDDFQNLSKLSTWLYRIVINESLDFLRKKKVRQNINGDSYGLVTDRLMADEYFDGNELQAKLQAAIATLPEVQRMVFNMKYYDDMKYSEISKILDTSEGALKSSYHIAVHKISDFFKKHD